jgi:shikimate 5-dehydrogenase
MAISKIDPGQIVIMTNKSQIRMLEHYTAIHHRDTYSAIDETLLQNSCKGCSVFIAGAGTGIGKAIALSFARAGASAIYIAARGKANLEETKSDVLRFTLKCQIQTFGMHVVNASLV